MIRIGSLVAGTLLALAAQQAGAQCRTAETESNNTEASANTGLCSGTPVSAAAASGDVDWYKFDINAAGTIAVSVNNASGLDTDWYLYKTTGSYVRSGATANNPETGTYAAAGPGTYYLKVLRYSGSGSYTLNLTYPGSSGGGSCTLPAGVNLGRVGSSADKATATSAGLVLMGGGTDVDAAMQWMIARSGGGDVVVIRATGTNGYNDYLYGLGTVNSVQTLLIDSTAEGDDACVAQTIRNAEMLFIAGGNQQDYVSYWKGRAVGNAINYLINTKKVPVGGTSAGMAILGQYYHPGGAPDDQTPLRDPAKVAIGTGFVSAPFLGNTVTDTHFSQRGRQARLVAFMASTLYNHGVTWQNIAGIAADEATAVAIDANGLGKVFGTNSVFFAEATGAPEVLANGSPLTWDRGGQAIKVYQVPGTASGTNTFNLSTWSGTGGTVHYWPVVNGLMTQN